MTPEQRRARGIAAQCILEDDTIRAAWEQIENDLHRDWENTGRFSHKERERLWVELRTIKALRKNLASFAGHAPRD